MARPRTEHVELVKQKLAARLNDGLHRPGSRFMSNRAVAQHFGVSYQTAHRLVRELVDEGLLERRAYSGTFVAGRRKGVKGVRLIFNSRARRPESFGYRLVAMLREAMESQRLAVEVSFVGAEEKAALSDSEYPVLWETPGMLEAVGAWGGFALLLHERTPHGLASLRIDSISVDDFLGGVLAGQVIGSKAGAGGRCVVFAGPRDDVRSQARVAGFKDRCKARVVHAPTWYFDDAAVSAGRCVQLKPDAIFACNDRLAQAVLMQYEARGLALPRVMGFDDAPIAESLHLSSIALPWKAMTEATVRMAQRRISGDTSTASDVILRPQPIIRLTT